MRCKAPGKIIEETLSQASPQLPFLLDLYYYINITYHRNAIMLQYFAT